MPTPKKKPVARKKVVRRKRTTAPPVANNNNTHMNIREAENGFVLNVFDNNTDKTFVFKDKAEAQKKVVDLMKKV